MLSAACAFHNKWENKLIVAKKENEGIPEEIRDSESAINNALIWQGNR